jgi:LemA protein
MMAGVEAEEGTMSKKLGCLIAVAVAVVVLGGWAVGSYNGLVDAEQKVEAQWANVEGAYQRRLDLIPNLVATVKGAADFEQSTLNQVVEARSRVGQVSAQAASQILSDPQSFARFQQAQDGLSSALSRLLVVVERYPELKATVAYRDLMVQLEGTENRINVERNNFNELAQRYNTRIKSFPGVLVARLFGFAAKPYFAAQAGAETAPKVEF